MMIAFLVYREISDQYGTSEVVGVYSSRLKAEEAAELITTRRTFIRSFKVDWVPDARPR